MTYAPGVDACPYHKTLLASAARTATTASEDQINGAFRGVMVTLIVTAVTADPALTLKIQAKMGGNYEDLLAADAAVTAAGVHTYIVYPAGIATSDDVVEASKLPLPRDWRVEVVHGDTDSATYSVEAALLL